MLATTPQLTVGTPGTQKSTLGTHVSVQIQARTNTGHALAYQSAGLPPCLSISRSTAKITGTSTVTAGIHRATVTVSDAASTDMISFSWQVSSRVGQVKGYRSRCADDYSGRTRDGNKIDLWSCDGQARQRITFTAAGELRVAGKSVTTGRGAVLEPCTGSAAQTWTRRADGEYVTGGRCLTDPRRSTRDGTQLVVARCNDDGLGQSWSLP